MYELEPEEALLILWMNPKKKLLHVRSPSHDPSCPGGKAGEKKKEERKNNSIYTLEVNIIYRIYFICYRIQFGVTKALSNITDR